MRWLIAYTIITFYITRCVYEAYKLKVITKFVILVYGILVAVLAALIFLIFFETTAHLMELYSV